MEVVRLARPGLMSLVHSWKSLWSPRLSPGHCPLYCKEGATSLGGVGSGSLAASFPCALLSASRLSRCLGNKSIYLQDEGYTLELVVVWEISIYIPS